MATSNFITIPLMHGKSTTIDLVDNDLISFSWHVTKGYKKGDPSYASHGVYLGKFNGKSKVKQVKLHRLIMERIIGRELVKGECVDHRDGNSLNNCRDNLRLATTSQNSQNRKPYKSKSGYKGVKALSNGRFVARIKVSQKWIFLGYFHDPLEAHKAYCAAATKHFGEFARFA